MPRKKTRKKATESRKLEILGILLIALGVLLLISLISYNPLEQPGNLSGGKISNRLGVAGVYIAYGLIHFCLGYPSIVFPIILIIFGWTLLVQTPVRSSLRVTGYLLAFALYTSIILAIPEITSGGESDLGFSLSGLVGGVIAKYLFGFMGVAGSIVILLALIMITIIGATKVSISNFFMTLSEQGNLVVAKIVDFVQEVRKTEPVSARKKKPRKLGQDFDWDDEPVETANGKNSFDFDKPEAKPKTQPKITIRKPLKESASKSKAPVTEVPGNEEPGPPRKYEHPSLDLLDPPTSDEPPLSEAELNANAQILEDRLLEFGVEGRVVEINPGPVITRYDIEPAAGVKISRIVGLSDDLALAMRARRIRIVAPIPGKGAVGIEIPNQEHATVFLREIISSKQFIQSKSPLTVALGKSISGEPFVTNLEKMPHLLIAGATGSGKSVCLNTIIASILYKSKPQEVQFVMIDPKRLELSVFNDLRGHHLTYKEDLNEEVATTADNAISILKSMCVLMEQRYEILARAGVRNIADYNKKFEAGQLKNLEHEEPYESLPYIVLIVDELADLMMTSAREIEEPIARLAQMARAIGIHLIVATQRPSVNVITGVIKANFPARIACQVASKIDSRTILDCNGAEKLLGRGDMLFVPQGSREPLRLHGAFVSIEEIESIIKHVRMQPKCPKRTLPEDQQDTIEMFDPTNPESVGPRDALFGAAAKLIVRHQQGSISLIQRRLSIGYARAARLIDQLEAAGVVGPYDGSKAREVLIDEEELEEMDLT